MIPDRPRLRPHLAADPRDEGRQSFAVHDLLRLSSAVLTVGPLELRLLQALDGAHTAADLVSLATRLLGRPAPAEHVARLIELLDESLFLDTPRFRAAADAPVRPPSCLGAYEADSDALDEQLSDLFGRGSGHPRPPQPGPRVRAVLAPHIDYARGGLTYTFAFKELYERSAARLFVVVGTSHYSAHRFTLTRKAFRTPLGVTPTDAAFIDRLESAYGGGLFDDEWMAHLPEHSIELEVVFLQHLYGAENVRIVPLVVGSFGDCVRSGRSPGSNAEIARMVAALRSAERAAGEPVTYVISGDLAHIGPKFDDPVRMDGPRLEHSRRQDQALMAAAEAGDAEGYFGVIAEEGDERNVCGLPPTWLVMQAAGLDRGRLLADDQYIHPRGKESV
ncbi:MAG: AmmeMemoRadiSam system protein B, partial [Gemmataceae bacterium]